MRYFEGTMDAVLHDIHHKLLTEAPQVNTGHWQGVEGTPHSQTRELSHVSIETPIPEDMGTAQWVCDPNLPWAEDHFQERVGGEPTNPGNQYMNWPWYRGGVEDHKAKGQFSHTYQERMWPRFANIGAKRPNGRQVYVPHNGIRYEYGDLGDLIHVLIEHPTTRQAYLPLWFPEDLHAATMGERVPCSLGWHFMIRDHPHGLTLDVAYYMRSVDFVRYFRDDVYMTMRLAHWVVNALIHSTMSETGLHELKPGTLHMHVSSLHVFEGDMPKMIREAPERP